MKRTFLNLLEFGFFASWKHWHLFLNSNISIQRDLKLFCSEIRFSAWLSTLCQLQFEMYYFLLWVFLFLNQISLVIAKTRLFIMVWAKYSAIRWCAGFPKEL